MLQQTAPEPYQLLPLPDQRKIGTKASASGDFKRPYEGQKYFSLFHTIICAYLHKYKLVFSHS